VGNPACGDVITIYIRLDGDKIAQAGFQSMGSVYQLATASVLCDCVTGQTIVEARARTPTCILEKLPDLPERHRYLARLALEAMQSALSEAEKGDRPRETPARTYLESREATRWMESLLAQGPKYTAEVDDAIRTAGVLLPRSTLKFLSQLRADGIIDGAMDLEARSWRWWILEAPAT